MVFLKRTAPGHDLGRFQDEVNRLFDGLGGLGTTWIPAVDVSEDGNGFTFRMDAPGLESKDVRIEMNGDTLSVRGERKNEMEQKDGIVHRVERVHGTFERSFRLTLPVDAGAIKASYKNGVLEIRVPKLEQVKKREITIDVE